MAGLFNFKNPQAMIMSLVFLIVGIEILVAQLPSVVTSIVNLSQISNLGFSSFFQAGGVTLLVLGAGVLFAVFGLIGLKGMGGRGF